jgi:hypothetical protein
MTTAFVELGISPRAFCVLVHAARGQRTQIELAKFAERTGPGS